MAGLGPLAPPPPPAAPPAADDGAVLPPATARGVASSRPDTSSDDPRAIHAGDAIAAAAPAASSRDSRAQSGHFSTPPTLPQPPSSPAPPSPTRGWRIVGYSWRRARFAWTIVLTRSTAARSLLTAWSFGRFIDSSLSSATLASS